MTQRAAKEKLIKQYCKNRAWCELYGEHCKKEDCEIYHAIKALEAEPTVRCKDCRYYCMNLIDEVTGLPMCGSWSAPQKQDGFCNYGERKDG